MILIGILFQMPYTPPNRKRPRPEEENQPSKRIKKEDDSDSSMYSSDSDSSIDFSGFREDSFNMTADITSGNVTKTRRSRNKLNGVCGRELKSETLIWLKNSVRNYCDRKFKKGVATRNKKKSLIFKMKNNDRKTFQEVFIGTPPENLVMKVYSKAVEIFVKTPR